MLPEVETFTEAIEAIEEAYAEECNTAANEWRREQTPATRRIYDIKLNTAHEIIEVRRNSAWKLLAASENPLVAWIAQNCRDNDDEARTVLENLPLDYAGLVTLADDKDWCTDTFDPYLRRAVEDGVVTGPATSPERTALLNLADDWELNRSDILTLSQHLEKIVAAEVAAARKTWSEEQAATAQATDADHGTIIVDLPEVSSNVVL